MAIKKNTLAEKLSEERRQSEPVVNNLQVDMKTELRDFTRKLWKEYEESPKNKARRLAICMLGYLYNDRTNAFIPRKINIIGDIYTFTKQEVRYGFKCYGEKTWLALNDILSENNLPVIVLPEEYSY